MRYRIVALLAVVAASMYVVIAGLDSLSGAGTEAVPSDAQPYAQPTDPPTLPPELEGPLSEVTCSAPSENLGFRNFWAGASFDGLRVSVVIRDCTVLQPDGPPTRVNYVSYLYGDCTGSGCPVPVEIQTWPVQDRNKAMYSIAPPEHRLQWTDTTVNGTPASIFEEGQRLEIWHEDVTVAIFGQNQQQIDLFANALVEGPRSLVELEASDNLHFSADCVNSDTYCEGVPVGVWYEPARGLCFGLGSYAQTRCTGVLPQPTSPLEVWQDPEDGICLSGSGTIDLFFCTGPIDTVGVWQDPDRGLCISVSTDPPKTWCSGDDVQQPNPVEVWYDPADGVCLKASNPALVYWCSGPFQT